ncbi:Uncharacterised protein [Plesiomonas shigelloides]|nr:Uncharacterised protein [Plesiomonas shigelloides]
MLSVRCTEIGTGELLDIYSVIFILCDTQILTVFTFITFSSFTT